MWNDPRYTYLVVSIRIVCLSVQIHTKQICASCVHYAGTTCTRPTFQALLMQIRHLLAALLDVAQKVLRQLRHTNTSHERHRYKPETIPICGESKVQQGVQKVNCVVLAEEAMGPEQHNRLGVLTSQNRP